MKTNIINRVEKMNKLVKVQKAFEDMKKVSLGIEEIELYKNENSYMVVLQDSNKRISVNQFNNKIMVMVSYKNVELELDNKLVKTQQEAINYVIEIMNQKKEVIISNKSALKVEEVMQISPESTAMNVTRESESARQLVKIMRLAGDSDVANVLDYGCGLGRNINYMYNETGNYYIDGCDTQKQVNNIKKDTQKMDKFNSLGMVITTSDKLKKESYDYVLNSHVLNVVPDDVKKVIVDDIYSLLVKGGKAVIQVRTASDVETATSKVKSGDGWLIKKGKKTTYQEGITQEKMVDLLTGAGFTIINHRFTKSIHMVEIVK